EAARRIVGAAEVRAAPLRALLGQLSPAALLRARDADGDLLDVLALGISRAADEPAVLALLEDHRLAALVADDAGLLGLRLGALPQVPRVLAVGVALARQEPAEAAPLLEELPLAAGGAGLVGGLALLEILHVDAGLLEVGGEGLIELPDRVDPLPVAFLDLVEGLLHLRREGDLEDVGERLEEEVDHRLAQLGGRQ